MQISSLFKSNLVRILLIGALAVGVVLASSALLPPGCDWEGNYRRASLAMFSGKSPYMVEPFFAPPWSLLPLLPFSILPVSIGRTALFWVSLITLAFTAYRLGARPLGVAIFILSPPVMHGLLNANIEWIPLLGFVLPPQVGLLLVTAKPQTGFAVALFWIAQAWRKGGVREILRISWPLLITFLLSLLLYGPWPLRLREVMPIAKDFNASFWPYTLPVGGALIVASLRKREIRWAMGASPCLSPYVLFHTWSAALVALVPATTELFVTVIGLWVLVALRASSGVS